jgi:hypothetical protein
MNEEVRPAVWLWTVPRYVPETGTIASLDGAGSSEATMSSRVALPELVLGESVVAALLLTGACESRADVGHTKLPLTSTFWDGEHGASACDGVSLLDSATIVPSTITDTEKASTGCFLMSLLEANAARRSIVRRDTGEGYQEFLTRLAQESGIATPTLAKLDRKRARKGSNEDWVNPHDPEARITKLKDGRTHQRALSLEIRSDNS